MAKYIVLLNWTDQGVRNVKDSPKRLDLAKELARKHGGEFKKFFMTTGLYDMVGILELPDDAAMARFALTIGMSGNIRTQTLKAFSEESYREIVGSL